nr:dTDP-glucose 4,6-dehydratase [Nocardioidaceae bacterium]
AETGWEPQYRDVRAGIEQTVAWYRENEDWWRRDKDRTESAYARLGR